MQEGFQSHGFSAGGIEPSGGFSQSIPSEDFPGPGWWATANHSSNGYHLSNGSHSLHHFQQLQETANSPRQELDGDVSVFSAAYSPDITNAMHSAGTTGKPDQGQTVFQIPNTAACILDHTALHNAVVTNDLHGTKALLEAGANPNCSARGGMTPLHYAATQRNGDLVRLLLEYGANPEARTARRRTVLLFAIRNKAHSARSEERRVRKA